MDSPSSPEKNPSQYIRASRAFRQFKNPPQPHMCIQDMIKDTTEKLFINVLGWQKIAKPKNFTDPIPLYGGMQVPQNIGLNSNRLQILVFAVMVNPEVLKANGKNAPNVADRDALVSLLCDFVEAMNPGLLLARNPVIIKDKDIAGELKDVWLAVQNKREKEKGINQDVTYKVYDIDGIGADDSNDEERNSNYSKARNNDISTIDRKKEQRPETATSGTASPCNTWNLSDLDKRKSNDSYNGKVKNDFFPMFSSQVESQPIDVDERLILEPMQKLDLQQTDSKSNNSCDNANILNPVRL